MNNNKNLTQSVKGRLLNIARERNENFTNLLIRYGLERLLYRLSKSDFAKKFVLKGATLFNYWHGEPHRATLDADFAVNKKISITDTEDIIKKICRIDVEDDGLVFLTDKIAAVDIRKEDAYQGIRVKLQAMLGKAVIPIQLDIGFGDLIVPPPEKIEYPTLLDFPAPKLFAYTPETSIAEKFQVMLEMGIVNSRMKDYYDIWFLIKQFDLDGIKLQNAIREILKRRKTAIPEGIPVAFSSEFVHDEQKQAQWKGFLKRLGISGQEMTLEKVIAVISKFIMPLINALRNKEEFSKRWHNGKNWIQV